MGRLHRRATPPCRGKIMTISWLKGGNVQIDSYYEHVNNTGVHPNHQVNAAGLMINLYFPPYKG